MDALKEKDALSISLTELLDVKVLQEVQDVFTVATGVPVFTTDTTGSPITDANNFFDLINDNERPTMDDKIRFQQNVPSLVEQSLKMEKAVPFAASPHHTMFMAPIMVKDTHIGFFVGGPIESLNTTHSVDDRESYFLYKIAKVISSIAYSHFRTIQANVEMERAANMKSDFLANMSHEIRTPMNAVIGMAEMALREDLTPEARNYINQIKSSGNALLVIINDILDFSKIESGKMDITPEEYEPMSIVNDVSNILMTRIGQKKVELILDIDPTLPSLLYGDNIRIQQVILNLANNAVKFTPKGKVSLEMKYDIIGPDEIELKFSVKDTGIGIKEADYNKLFQSFQQLDSKRNRNKEGSGLGLAISKQLLTLMDGDIWLDKEYTGGSSFSFKLPQKVRDWTPSVQLKETEPIVVAGLLKNDYIKEQIRRDALSLGVEYVEVDEEEHVEQIIQEGATFLFIEEQMFTPYMEYFTNNNPQITSILLTDFTSEQEYDTDNLLIIKKPLYLLNMAMIFNHEDIHMITHDLQNDEILFTAPEAEILIVDDNAINLTVAEGLLRPLQMKVDTALSGKVAINKISVKKYDLIFMDHMMPGIDGVEATRIIRRFYSDYENVPIIALTANAVSGVKEMFIAEGMNDFVAKPIELKILLSKVKQWLPPEKIQRTYTSFMPETTESTQLKIADLDTSAALHLLGSEELYWKVLADYYSVIEKKATLIKQYEENENWQDYTVEVHSLKSASKQIGATSLSNKALVLEEAGNLLRNAETSPDLIASESAFVHIHTQEMLDEYLHYLKLLAPYMDLSEQSEEDKTETTSENLTTILEKMKRAADDLDMDEMEAVIEKLSQYRFDEKQKVQFNRLKLSADEMDVDSCIEISEEWIKML